MSTQLPLNHHYAETHSKMQTGDIIAFGGNTLFSKWTKLTTGSPVTHISVVVQPQMLGQENGRVFNQVVEATKYNGKSGVMVNCLNERIRHYDGDVWWLPLHQDARARLQYNQQRFFDFLFEQEHKEYDIWQLFGSVIDLTDKLPFINKLTQNCEDFSSWFCSELVAEALEIAQVVERVNASETTPVDICRFNIFEPNYTQLKGEPNPIKGFNSLSASGWGH